MEGANYCIKCGTAAMVDHIPVQRANPSAAQYENTPAEIKQAKPTTKPLALVILAVVILTVVLLAALGHNASLQAQRIGQSGTDYDFGTSESDSADDIVYRIMDEGSEGYIGETIEYTGTLDGQYAPIGFVDWYAVDFNDPRVGSSDPHIMCIVTDSTEVINDMRIGTDVKIVGTVVKTPTLESESALTNEVTSRLEFEQLYGYGFCVKLDSIERL
jgi:hypothetical protein